MNKKIMAIYAMFILASANCLAFSKVTKGDDIVIPIEVSESENDTTIFRSLPAPIYAVFSPNQALISLNFISDCGNVFIMVSNLLSGESLFYEESSQSGSIIIPFIGGTGFYCIRIKTDKNISYHGYFNVD